MGEILWADIEALTQHSVAESAQLEFKKTLSHPKGELDGWYADRDVSRHAKEELAFELVAFANAYGGTLVLGVDENRQRPPAATTIVPVPRVHELAEKLRASISAMIDPPIESFDLQPVTPPDDPSEGVIVFRVGPSALAPHGAGIPPRAYVRRGTSCAPMTMRDVQSRFWEARTAQGRVDAIRAESQRRFTHFAERAYPPERSRAVAFRCNAIPEGRLDIGPINHRSSWLLNLCPSAGQLGFAHSAASSAGVHDGWLPRAHGAFSRTWDEHALWNVTDDGTVTVEGFMLSPDSQHDPSWYAAVALQVLVTAGRLRMRSLRPDVPIQIEMELRLGENVTRPSRPGFQVPAPLRQSSIGPFSLLRRSDLPDVFGALEREIYAAFASIVYERTEVEPERELDDWLRSFP